MKLVDTHQHLIYPEEVEIPWASKYPPLKDKAFRLDNYAEASTGYQIEKSLFMEVDVAETDMRKEALFFSELSRSSDNRLSGIIAACRPEHEGFREHLDAIVSDAIKGMRRVLHVVPDAVSTSTLFRDNVRRLSEYDLRFDMCYLSRQLPLAYELVSACPNVTFVLDHCGNPDVANGEFDTWKTRMRKLATLPNVNCKLSGISVNCGDKTPDSPLIHPYLDICLEAFGPDRLVFGSDWPVCLIGVELSGWLEVFTNWAVASLSEDEREKVCCKNALRIYRI